MSRDQRSIDELRRKIDNITKLIANPDRSYEMVRELDVKRQKYHRALKILEKKQ